MCLRIEQGNLDYSLWVENSWPFPFLSMYLQLTLTKKHNLKLPKTLLLAQFYIKHLTALFQDTLPRKQAQRDPFSFSLRLVF